MICFRDMSFCSAECLTVDCRRQFTPEVRAAARRWWGGDEAPIAFADFSPDCPDYAPAIGIEARSGETRTRLDPKDESPAIAQTTQSESSHG